MIRLLIFDWGGTVMTDTGEPGPMYLWKEVSWVPGCREAITALNPIPCCIATNAGISDTAAMRRALARIGADRFFTHFFSSKDLGVAKPDPRFFEVIAAKTGTETPDCVMIGNDYEKDICGAKLAGMQTVFYNPTPAAGPFPMADAVISEMERLPEIIQMIERSER